MLSFSTDLFDSFRPSIRSGPLQDQLDRCLYDDLQIKPYAPVIDVIGIECDNFLKIRDLAAAACLPHACDSGFDGQASPMPGVISCDFIDRGRTCADEAHRSEQHVKKLR